MSTPNQTAPADTAFSRPMGVNYKGYYGTADALDKQLKHGEAMQAVIRAARRYIHGVGDSGRNLLHLIHTIHALDALEGK